MARWRFLLPEGAAWPLHLKLVAPMGSSELVYCLVCVPRPRVLLSRRLLVSVCSAPTLPSHFGLSVPASTRLSDTPPCAPIAFACAPWVVQPCTPVKQIGEKPQGLTLLSPTSNHPHCRRSASAQSLCATSCARLPDLRLTSVVSLSFSVSAPTSAPSSSRRSECVVWRGRGQAMGLEHKRWLLDLLFILYPDLSASAHPSPIPLPPSLVASRVAATSARKCRAFCRRSARRSPRETSPERSPLTSNRRTMIVVGMGPVVYTFY
jgi:hypothetical protein